MHYGDSTKDTYKGVNGSIGQDITKIYKSVISNDNDTIKYDILSCAFCEKRHARLSNILKSRVAKIMNKPSS